MKKHIIQPYYLRRVVKASKKRNTWNVSIPPEYVEILKLDNDYVEMQIIDDVLLLKRNKRNIAKKEFEKINSKNISEDTTAKTIKNEIEEESENETQIEERTTPQTESSDSPIKKSTDDNLEEIKKNLFGKNDTKKEKSDSIEDSLDADIMAQLEQ